MNTIEFLQISAAVVPEREALVEVGGGGRRLTYAEMQEQVTRLANAIRGLGVEQGDKIAVMAQNSANFVLTYYACAMLGVTLVPLNYRSKDEELSHMLNVSQAGVLFVSERYLELVNRIRPTLEHTKTLVSYDGRGGRLRRLRRTWSRGRRRRTSGWRWMTTSRRSSSSRAARRPCRRA